MGLWMMSEVSERCLDGRCLKGVQKVPGMFLKDLEKLSSRSLEVPWMLFGRCLKVSGRWLKSIKSEQVKSG